MHIIIGRENAELLKDRFTVLELETLTREGQTFTAFCVVPADRIPLDQFADIETHKQLHADLITNYYKNNYKFCQDAIEHLRGKFGGELDSFYDEISARILNLEQEN